MNDNMAPHIWVTLQIDNDSWWKSRSWIRI